MNIINSWLSRDFFVKAVLLYLVLLLFFGVVMNHNLPAMPIVSMQVIYVFLVLIFSFFYSKKSITQLLICIFTFQFLCCVGLRFFHYHYFYNPLGFNPVDAAFYDDLGKFSDLPYKQYIARLFMMGLTIDDIGFPTIIYVVYKIFGNIGKDVLVFFNVCVITWGCYYLYKTSILYFDKAKSSFICFFWGIEAFAVRTAAVGLKENFFAFIMTAAMFYLCKIYKKSQIKDYTLFILFACFTLFFRIALFYAFIVTFIAVIFLKSKTIRKNVWFLIILVLVFVLININTILGNILESRGYSLDSLEYTQETKGSGAIQWVLNYVAAFIGPVPSFVSDEFKRNYITLYSFTPFTKMLFSLFFISGVWYALKNKMIQYFPFVLMWVMNTIMIVFTFFSQHDRFQWPHIPYALILSCLGYEALKKSYNKRIIENFYLAVVLLIIVAFNFRL